MAEDTFEFSAWPVVPPSSPFSETVLALVPMVEVIIGVNGKTAWLEAVVDTGAPLSVFPISKLEECGVDTRDKGRFTPFSLGTATRGRGVSGILHQVELQIESFEAVTATVGFSDDLPDGVALLGWHTALQHFEVSFYPSVGNFVLRSP